MKKILKRIGIILGIAVVVLVVGYCIFTWVGAE